MASDLTVQTIRGPGSGANANQILVPSGQKLLAPGHIVQAIQYQFIGTSATTSTDYVNSRLIGSITPSSTNSKIFITMNMMIDNAGAACVWTIFRNGTNLGAYGNGAEGFGASSGSNRSMISGAYIDSPNSTSPVEYIVKFKSSNGATVEFPPYSAMVTALILMEIAQ